MSDDFGVFGKPTEPTVDPFDLGKSANPIGIVEKTLAEKDAEAKLLKEKADKEAEALKLKEIKPVVEEKRTTHVIGGRSVSITDAENTQYETLLKELSDSLRGRNMADVPLSDEYYTKSQALDLFVANLS